MKSSTSTQLKKSKNTVPQLEQQFLVLLDKQDRIYLQKDPQQAYGRIMVLTQP